MGIFDRIEQEWSDFRTGSQRIAAGDVSINEFQGNLERRTRQALFLDDDTEDFVVGLQRIATGTVGEATPTTRQEFARRNALASARNIQEQARREGSPAPDIIMGGGRQPNPSYREAWETTSETIDNATDVVSETLAEATETVAEAAGGAAEGFLGGLLKTPAGAAAVAGAAALLLSR